MTNEVESCILVIENGWKLLAEYRKKERERRGIKLQLKPADVILKNHRENIKNNVGRRIVTMRVRSYTIYPSRNHFRTLNRTRLADLLLETPASGKYLMLRVIEEAFVNDGWHTVMEDDAGDVCNFSVYNYPEKELFPVGTVLIFKEPYFNWSEDGLQRVRSDCPSDIIVLRRSHPLFYMSEEVQWKNKLSKTVEDPLFSLPIPTSASDWLNRGSELYAKAEPVLAREAFTLGLKQRERTDDVWKDLQLNLAAVHLDLGYYEKTIATAEEVLREYPTDRQSLLNVGKAHYYLRQYKEASATFKKIRQFHPGHVECEVELRAFEKYVDQPVDIKQLQEQSEKAPYDKFECIDDYGPLKIVLVSGKGRGLVLTEDVTPGTLLMISSAFAFTLDPMETAGFEIDSYERWDPSKYHGPTVSQLTQAVFRNPNTFGSLVYNFSAGDPIIEKIQHFCDPETKEEVICDVEKIIDINKTCSFTIRPYDFNRYGHAVSIPLSYINHSCVPNITLNMINNVFFVYADDYLKSGDEIFASYLKSSLLEICTREERQKILSYYKVICHCQKCENG